ncbi:SusC/RagA family TonB-linked outer membrane protein [Chitinophaga lutea]
MTQQIDHSTNRRLRKVACLAMAALLGTSPLLAQDTFALNRKVTFDARKAPVVHVLEDIEKQTHLNIVYDGSQLDRSNTVTLRARNKSLSDVLHALFPKNSEFRVIGNQVVVRPVTQSNPAQPAPEPAPQQVQRQEVSGTVVLRDAKGDLQYRQGITIRVKDQPRLGAVTNEAGFFRLQVPAGAVLVVSYIGYTTKEFPVEGRSSLKLMLDEDKSNIKEVVITGVFERQKESFTGSAATYSGEQLKTVGNQNVIQSLRSLDPAFTVFENNRLGSDPNAMPDVEIQGRTSILGVREQLGANSINLPLFILDGFQTNIQMVMALDINRIESVTVLKDAASTAIYGSRAANGVIVIETRKPKAGELRVTYSHDNTISIPDLRDYNLMNAAEKLEFERLSGRYTLPYQFRNYYDRQMELDSLYNAKKMEVEKGVDTYWMNEPLRTAFTQAHSLYLEGGDNQMRYGVGLNYRMSNGVMKGSDRNTGGGQIKLMYRKGKLLFSNNLMIDFLTSHDSPWGSFSSFSRANPYYRKRNEDGSIPRLLEYSISNNGTLNYDVYNPLWDASLPNAYQTKGHTIINNFQAEWLFHPDIRLRARLGVNMNQQRAEDFTSSMHSSFRDVSITERGKYTSTRTDASGFDGDLSLTYGKMIGRHRINAIGGWSARQSQSMRDQYVAVGFPDFVNSPAYAASYLPGGKPQIDEATLRATSFFLQGGYAFDNRYLVDVSYRIDGSSNYGTNRLFTNTWSVGAAWNLHAERIIDPEIFNMLRLRASIGNPGNENGVAYQSFTTYQYNTALQNYFGIGSSVNAFGNPDLAWQHTLKKTVGVDAVIKNRLRLQADYVMQSTDPLLAIITVPASIGTKTITTNIGTQISNGYNFSLSYSPIYRPQERIIWTLTFMGKHERAHFENIGNKMDAMNKLNRSLSLDRYYDGGSPTSLWAVRSQGIDPATGQEVFLKKNDSTAFEFDWRDEVVIGDSRPDLDGIIGTTLNYKGVTFQVKLRYRIGGDQFNDALFNKVENISQNGLKSNQDKRALYDRWKRAGDRSRFKNISLTETTNMSSRFVQEEQTLAGESITLGYEINSGFIRRWRLSYIRVNGYVNDMFRLSSIKRERGIDYPFANSFGFSLSVGF